MVMYIHYVKRHCLVTSNYHNYTTSITVYLTVVKM